MYQFEILPFVHVHMILNCTDAIIRSELKYNKMTGAWCTRANLVIPFVSLW